MFYQSAMNSFYSKLSRGKIYFETVSGKWKAVSKPTFKKRYALEDRFVTVVSFEYQGKTLFAEYTGKGVFKSFTYTLDQLQDSTWMYVETLAVLRKAGYDL